MANPITQNTVGRTWMFGDMKKAPIRIAKGTGKGADLAGLKVNEPKWTFGSQVKNFFEPGRKAQKIAEWQAREAATQASSTGQKPIESKHHKPEFAQRSNADKAGVSNDVTSAKTADLQKPSVQPSTERSSRVSQLEECAHALTEEKFKVPFRTDATSPKKWIDEHKQTLRPQAQKMKDQLAAMVGSRELSSLSNDELHDIAAAVWSVVIPGLHSNYCTAIPEASKSLVNELLHAVATNPLFDGLDKANRKDAIKAMFYFAYFNRGFQALLCERSDRMKELEAIRPKQRTAEQKAELAKEAELALLMARVAAFGAAACGLVLETKPMSICPSKEAIASGTAFYKALSSEALSRAGISREGPHVRKRAGRPDKEGSVSFSFTGNKGAIRAGVPDATKPGTLITDWKSPFSGIRKRFEEGFSFVFGPKKKLAEEETPGKPNSDRMADQGHVQPGLPNASAEDLQEQRSNPEQRFHQGSDDGASSVFHPLTPGLTPPSSKDSLLEDISLNDLDPVVDTPATDAGEGSTSSTKPADASVTQGWRSPKSKFDDLCRRFPKVAQALQEAYSPSKAGTVYETTYDSATTSSYEALEAVFPKDGKDIEPPKGLEWFANGRLTAVVHALCAALWPESPGIKPNVTWNFSYDPIKKAVLANYSVQTSRMGLKGGFEFSAVTSDWKRLDVSVPYLMTTSAPAIPDDSQPAQISDKDAAEDSYEDHPHTPTPGATNGSSDSPLLREIVEVATSAGIAPALPALADDLDGEGDQALIPLKESSAEKSAPPDEVSSRTSLAVDREDTGPVKPTAQSTVVPPTLTLTTSGGHNSKSATVDKPSPSKPVGQQAAALNALPVAGNSATIKPSAEARRKKFTAGALPSEAWQHIQSLKSRVTFLTRDGRYACKSRVAISAYAERQKSAKSEAIVADPSVATNHDELASQPVKEQKISWKKEMAQTLKESSDADYVISVRQAFNEMLKTRRLNRSDLLKMKGEDAETFIYELTRDSVALNLNLVNLGNTSVVLDKLYEGNAGDKGGQYYQKITNAVDAVLGDYFKQAKVVKSKESRPASWTDAANMAKIMWLPQRKFEAMLPERMKNVMRNADPKRKEVDYGKFADAVIKADRPEDLSDKDKARYEALLTDERLRLDFRRLKSSFAAWQMLAASNSFSDDRDRAYVEAFPPELRNTVSALNAQQRIFLKGYLADGFMPPPAQEDPKLAAAAIVINDYVETTGISVNYYTQVAELGRKMLLEA